MTQEFEKVFERAKEVSLSKQEKENIKAKLREYIAANNAPAITSSSFSWFIYLRRHGVVTTLAAVIFVWGSMSVAAESALPGDFLYAVKTDFNEKVRGWFTGSPRSVAEWNVTLAERRLSEVEKLQAKHKLSPYSEDYARAQLEVHTKKAEDFINSKKRFEKEITAPAQERASAMAKTLEISADSSIQEEVESESISNERREEILRSVSSLRQRIDDLSSFSRSLAGDESLEVRLHIVRAREIIFEITDLLSEGKEARIGELLSSVMLRVDEIEQEIRQLQSVKNQTSAALESVKGKTKIQVGSSEGKKAED